MQATPARQTRLALAAPVQAGTRPSVVHSFNAGYRLRPLSSTYAQVTSVAAQAQAPAPYPVMSADVPRLTAAAPAPQAATAQNKQRTKALPDLSIDGISHPPVTLADLRPGDICFTYKPQDKNWRQRLIGIGQRAVNVGSRSYRGNPHIVHAFMVLESFPLRRMLHVVDAAGGKYVGIGRMAFSFEAPEKADDQLARYVVYRFADTQMRSLTTQLAMNWSAKACQNFSPRRAVLAPLKHRDLRADTRLRLRHLARHLFSPKPVPALKGQGYYKVMCSEFVANIGAVAAMNLYCTSHSKKITSRAAWKGLRRGPAGKVFFGDPRGMLPACLQARMVRDRKVRIVGYLPTCAELIANEPRPADV